MQRAVLHEVRPYTRRNKGHIKGRCYSSGAGSAAMGISSESGMVEAIAEAAGKEILAHQYLRARSLALYCRHAAMALLLGHLVH